MCRSLHHGWTLSNNHMVIKIWCVTWNSKSNRKHMPTHLRYRLKSNPDFILLAVELYELTQSQEKFYFFKFQLILFLLKQQLNKRIFWYNNLHLWVRSGSLLNTCWVIWLIVLCSCGWRNKEVIDHSEFCLCFCYLSFLLFCVSWQAYRSLRISALRLQAENLIYVVNYLSYLIHYPLPLFFLFS